MIHISAGIRQTALHALGLSLGSRRIQRSRKSNPVNSPSVSDTAIDSVLVHDQVLAVSVDKKTDQVRAHIVTAEIGQRFGKMDLVEVNLFDDQLVDILAKKKKTNLHLRQRKEVPGSLCRGEERGSVHRVRRYGHFHCRCWDPQALFQEVC
jgi:hypothetical protein